MTDTNNHDRDEIDKFNLNAEHWWDKNGELKTLHDINPVRLDFIRSHIDLKQQIVLDVGCGGGILSESLAQAAASVTAIDLAADLLATARAHAKHSELNIDYQHCSAEDLAQTHPETFDVITCMEMLEHVPDPQSVIAALSQLAKPDALIFLSTLNRTLKAYLTAIIGAEYILQLLPKKTHDYDKFIRPAELATLLRANNLELVDLKGMSYQPFSRQARLTANVDVNYLVCCRKLSA